MADTPRGGPPPEKVAATSMSESKQPRDLGSNTSAEYTTPEPPDKILSDAERRHLKWLAVDLCPHGTLRRYVPYSPSWCRRIGRDFIGALLSGRRLDPTEIWLLQDAHRRAVAKQQEERQAAEKEAEEEREWRERLRQLKRNARLLRGGR
jgi:hypothetical protein